MTVMAGREAVNAQVKKTAGTMSFFNPLTWDFDFFLLRGGNEQGAKRMRKERLTLAGVYLATFAISMVWLALVTKYVPDPYLDEIFHIPQAQAYCRGDFHIWDPKLTTPPGLYIISTVLIKLIRGGSCTVLQLRATNCFTLLLLLPAAHGCRRTVMRRPVKKELEVREFDESAINWDAVHTAVNICLFPPIFFFSGLYYTDVLSTFVVIKGYEHFLQGQNRQPGSVRRGLYTFLTGIMALLMRQTNIFWAAVFMGGLELARSFHRVRMILPGVYLDPHKGRSENTGQDSQSGASHDVRQGPFNTLVMAAYNGAFHDPSLEQAGAFDLFWCAISLGATAISNPRRVAIRLWPYITLLLSFAAFVLWNGGVVLGDKSNHVATIHLPQMLYIWPFIAFFSLPLLLYNIPDILFSFFSSLKWWSANFPGAGRRPQLSTVGWLFIGTSIALGVIYFNTIIHPFTLADNRHYAFYVFRYTIRRHPAVRYQLAPIYIACAFFIFRTLAGYPLPRLDATTSSGKNEATFPSKQGQSARSDSLITSSFPSTSFTIIWLISTALSLITAPLVEPRYFIIPWVIWRLHVPALPLASDYECSTKGSNVGKETRMETSISCWAGWMKYWACKGHDHRLWLETIWFLLISVITGSIFIFKGFEWPQEPGKVQRFMW